MQASRHRKKPIASIQSLARGLGVSERTLRQLAKGADRYYHPNKPQLKSDGTFRQHYRVAPTLKQVQLAINKHIFRNTEFPRYLTGGIRDPKHPRDYVANAKAHAGRRYIITEDIRNFFPSIRAEQVRRMWSEMYHMPPKIAELLTTLTTYRGYLPQGAPTSTYIGNLVLWDEEPKVVELLESMGFRYTRYVDNITLSSNQVYSGERIREVTSLLYGMLYRHGLRPKRQKRRTFTRKKAQRLHNLNLNSGRPTVPRAYRRRLWRETRIANAEYDNMTPEEQERTFRSFCGRIAMVKRFHHSQGVKLARGAKFLHRRHRGQSSL